MSGGEIVISAVALVGGAVGTYVGLRLVPIEQHLNDRKEARKKEAEDIDKRLQGLHDDAEKVKERFEQRLALIEQSYVSRTELERTINSVGDRMDRALVRVENGMRELGSKVDHLAERVSKVEVS